MKRVIIIGAGPAGITAGLELKRRAKDDFDVTILEEENRIGGISATVNFEGNMMDLGGHRFFSKDERINDWWDSILPMQSAFSRDDLLTGRSFPLNKDGKNPEKEDKVMLLRRRVSRIYSFGKFFDYPVTLNADTLKNLGFKRTVKSGVSYLASLVKKKNEDSLENFYINRFGKELYEMFFESYTEKLWGRHPKNISADWGSQRVKGISVTEVLKNALSGGNKSKETSLIEQFKYPKLGPGQLWSCAAEEFISLGGKIETGQKVSEVTLKGDKIVSVTAGDKEYKADVFLSSMPIKDLIESIGEDVPSNVKEVASGLPYRDFVTVGLLVDRLAIKNETKIKTVNSIVPDCWIYIQDKGVRLGRIQIFNNWSPYLVKDAENTVWLGLEYFCNEGDAFWEKSEDDCAHFALEELKKIGIIDSSSTLLGYHRERVKKAYPAYFDTYSRLGEVKEYLNKIDNLYCIGRNGQHRYNNMDHSMLTAIYAAEDIISGKSDKEKIWSVNTEKDYHEEKSE